MGNEKMIFFFTAEHFLSQWYPCTFELDQITFGSAEQWMMYAKARLFGDLTAAQNILATFSARTQKSIGQSVRHFEESTWNQYKQKIVYRGNYAKFSQNPELKKNLLATKEKVLAEASPYDKIWGIGLSMADARRFNQSQWRGRNLLGKTLMQVRSDLRSPADNEPGESSFSPLLRN